MTDCPDTPRPITPLRQRMIEDMAARNLDRHTQRSHISQLQAVRRLPEALAGYGDGRRGDGCSSCI